MPEKLVAIDATLVAGTNTGDSTYWTELVQALSDTPNEFRFLLLSNNEPSQKVPALGDRFTWVRLHSKRRWQSLVAMPQYAKQQGASVFHTQYSLSPLAVGGVTTIHDVSFFVEPGWFKPKDRILLRRSVPASAKRAKKVITVSETSKSEIVKYLKVPGDKVAVTPLAASDRFAPVDSSKVLSKYGISGPYLLAVGTQWPRKNLNLAIGACELLASRFPHQLVIAGKYGWGENSPGKRTKLIGYVEPGELASLYSGADLFLMPSLHEGFGLPVLEAMACGTPVIASSGGALPEVVGNSGVKVDSFEPKDWANQIESLLGDADNLKSLSEMGQRRSKEFSWRRTAELTLDVYREVAG